MLTPTWYPSVRQLRQFALIALPGFGLIGSLALRAGGRNTAMVFWTLGVVICLMGLVSPLSVRPIYALMIAITLPIGWLVSNVLLMAIFYVFMTGLGLIFRLIGRDALRVRKPSGDSYWMDCPQSADAAGYYRQA